MVGHNYQHITMYCYEYGTVRYGNVQYHDALYLYGTVPDTMYVPLIEEQDSFLDNFRYQLLEFIDIYVRTYIHTYVQRYAVQIERFHFFFFLKKLSKDMNCTVDTILYLRK